MAFQLVETRCQAELYEASYVKCSKVGYTEGTLVLSTTTRATKSLVGFLVQPRPPGEVAEATTGWARSKQTQVLLTATRRF
jgi:hypothetical protein